MSVAFSGKQCTTTVESSIEECCRTQASCSWRSRILRRRTGRRQSEYVLHLVLDQFENLIRDCHNQKLQTDLLPVPRTRTISCNSLIRSPP